MIQRDGVELGAMQCYKQPYGRINTPVEQQTRLFVMLSSRILQNDGLNTSI